MKIAELKKTVAPAPSAESKADVKAEEPQGTTETTPSGVEILYQWAPRRLYRLRQPGGQWSGGPMLPHEWREVPSVTTVLGVLDKSGPLVWWSQKIGVDGLLTLLREGKVKHRDIHDVDAQQIVDLLVEHKLSVNHVKDSAADRGVNVHGALEQWAEHGIQFHPDDYPEHERGYIEGLVSFIVSLQNDVGGIETELMVGSLEHSYAGRFDLVLTLSKPVEVVTRCYPKKPSKVEEIPAGRYLLDLKTSKRVYDTHFLQLEAYEAAAVECGYQPTDHRGVVHVTADGRYELVLNKDWRFDDFLAVRACYQVMHEREVLRVLREELDATEVST